MVLILNIFIISTIIHMLVSCSSEVKPNTGKDIAEIEKDATKPKTDYEKDSIKQKTDTKKNVTKPKTDLEEDGINGIVKEIIIYYSKITSGELTKDGIRRFMIYNKDGYITEEANYNSDGSLENKYTYTYDSYNNRIEECHFFGEREVPDEGSIIKYIYW